MTDTKTPMTPGEFKALNDPCYKSVDPNAYHAGVLMWDAYAALYAQWEEAVSVMKGEDRSQCSNCGRFSQKWPRNLSDEIKTVLKNVACCYCALDTAQQRIAELKTSLQESLKNAERWFDLNYEKGGEILKLRQQICQQHERIAELGAERDRLAHELHYERGEDD